MLSFIHVLLGLCVLERERARAKRQQNPNDMRKEYKQNRPKLTKRKNSQQKTVELSGELRQCCSFLFAFFFISFEKFL